MTRAVDLKRVKPTAWLKVVCCKCKFRTLRPANTLHHYACPQCGSDELELTEQP